MRLRILISAMGLIMFPEAYAQKFPVNEMNTFFNHAFGRVSRGISDNSSFCKSAQEDRFRSGVNQAVQKIHSLTGYIPVR